MTGPIQDWLATEGRRCASTQDFLHGVISRLNEQGLQILRSVINIRTLHPEVGAITYQWYNEDLHLDVPSHLILRREKFIFDQARIVMNIVRRQVFEIAREEGASYRNSPFYTVRFKGERVRTTIPAAEGAEIFPIYEDLASIRATGYYARELIFTDGERNVVTIATAQPDVFTDANIALLDELTDQIATYVEIHAQRLLMQTLLEIYLGENTGQQVLAGQIQRGDLREIRSVIWFSDLRNITELTERTGNQVIEILNQYFETVAESIEAHGGEILKFIGDALLAIFPVSEDERAAESAAARSALRAAFDAGTQLAALNESRQAAGETALLQHGIGLHSGLVQYGNIGSRDRLDFTVIGSAVNMASRLEGLCGRLGEAIVLSSDLAAAVPDCTRSLGRFALKGIADEQEVFAPTERPG